MGKFVLDLVPILDHNLKIYSETAPSNSAIFNEFSEQQKSTISNDRLELFECKEGADLVDMGMEMYYCLDF